MQKKMLAVLSIFVFLMGACSDSKDSSNRCTPGEACTTPGYTCSNERVCVLDDISVICKSNQDCEADEKCSGGLCITPDCESNDDCSGDGYTCSGFKCVAPECVSTSDCKEANSECVSNKCVVKAIQKTVTIECDECAEGYSVKCGESFHVDLSVKEDGLYVWNLGPLSGRMSGDSRTVQVHSVMECKSEPYSQTYTISACRKDDAANCSSISFKVNVTGVKSPDLPLITGSLVRSVEPNDSEFVSKKYLHDIGPLKSVAAGTVEGLDVAGNIEGETPEVPEATESFCPSKPKLMNIDGSEVETKNNRHILASHMPGDEVSFTIDQSAMLNPSFTWKSNAVTFKKELDYSLSHFQEGYEKFEVARFKAMGERDAIRAQYSRFEEIAGQLYPQYESERTGDVDDELEFDSHSYENEYSDDGWGGIWDDGDESFYEEEELVEMESAKNNLAEKKSEYEKAMEEYEPYRKKHDDLLSDPNADKNELHKAYEEARKYADAAQEAEAEYFEAKQEYNDLINATSAQGDSEAVAGAKSELDKTWGELDAAKKKRAETDKIAQEKANAFQDLLENDPDMKNQATIDAENEFQKASAEDEQAQAAVDALMKKQDAAQEAYVVATTGQASGAAQSSPAEIAAADKAIQEANAAQSQADADRAAANSATEAVKKAYAELLVAQEAEIEKLGATQDVKNDAEFKEADAAYAKAVADKEKAQKKLDQAKADKAAADKKASTSQAAADAKYSAAEKAVAELKVTSTTSTSEQNKPAAETNNNADTTAVSEIDRLRNEASQAIADVKKLRAERDEIQKKIDEIVNSPNGQHNYNDKQVWTSLVLDLAAKEGQLKQAQDKANAANDALFAALKKEAAGVESNVFGELKIKDPQMAMAAIDLYNKAVAKADKSVGYSQQTLAKIEADPKKNTKEMQAVKKQIENWLQENKDIRPFITADNEKYNYEKLKLVYGDAYLNKFESLTKKFVAYENSFDDAKGALTALDKLLVAKRADIDSIRARAYDYYSKMKNYHEPKFAAGGKITGKLQWFGDVKSYAGSGIYIDLNVKGKVGNKDCSWRYNVKIQSPTYPSVLEEGGHLKRLYVKFGGIKGYEESSNFKVMIYAKDAAGKQISFTSPEVNFRKVGVANQTVEFNKFKKDGDKKWRSLADLGLDVSRIDRIDYRIYNCGGYGCGDDLKIKVKGVHLLTDYYYLKTPGGNWKSNKKAFTLSQYLSQKTYEAAVAEKKDDPNRLQHRWWQRRKNIDGNFVLISDSIKKFVDGNYLRATRQQ